MALLPTIQNGGVTGQSPTGHYYRRKKEPRSLLEISQSISSIRNDEGKKLRSRSYDPSSSGDEADNMRNRKKVKIDRSKSVDHKRNLKRPQDLQDINKEYMYNKENVGTKKKYKETTGNTRHVRFDGTPEEQFGKHDQEKQSGFATSSPKHAYRSIANSDRAGHVSDNKHHEQHTEGSPTGPRRQPPHGTHLARLEAARLRARIWAETYSDPGPPVKSIDNDKVLRGQPVDPRKGPVPNDQARAKHAQYINKGKQDGRPKAAEAGRRSLPPKKESNASPNEERPANSAPAKEQGQLNGPMPKINTFVAKDNQNTKTHEPHTGVSKQPDPTPSPVKTREPSPTKVKQPQIMPAKTSEQKTETKTSEPVQTKPKTEEKPKVTETTRKLSDKSPEPARTAFNPAGVSGVAGRTTQEEDNNNSNKFSSSVRPSVRETSPTKSRSDSKPLPSDDHGPVIQPAKPVQNKPEQTTSENDDNFRYYASEKRPGQGQEVSPRIHSERSSKTDKSWTTIKTKTTDENPNNYSPVKSYTTYNMASSGQKAENKRREVTIVDPKDARQFISDEEKAEAFLQEYEYHHHLPQYRKDFNDMDDEEKIEYFRDKLHMKPDQIRELTFHPKVTEPKLIHHAYTGVETVNWLSGSSRPAKRPKSKKNVYKKQTMVVPNQKKSVMLTRLQGKVYTHINKVYGASPRDIREKQFFEKLSQLQIDEMQSRYERMAEKERKTLEAKFRQREQLKRLRKRFEDDSWRRFMTQYVTSKVMESEYRDRHEYGLPNDLNERGRPYNNASRSVSRRKQQTLTPRRLQRKNQQKYSTIFRYNTGPIHKVNGKPLKFEGIDTVYIDTEDEEDYEETPPGKPSKKKQNVEALMREARRILDQSDENDTDLEETPRKSRATNRRPERIYREKTRDRKHIRDDKSYQSSKTSRSKASSRAPPKTMKELMERRNNIPAKPVNRYQASSFAAMKSDLLKDSAILNKNKRLPSSNNSAITNNETNKPKVKEPVVERKPESPQPVNREPVKPPSPVQTVVTKTTTSETVVTTQTNGENAERKGKTPESSAYLDNMETQVAIDTARDKENEPTPKPSRASSKADVKSDQKVGSRTPSRVSYRASQDLSASQKDVRPPRAPSRTSVTTTESKTIEAVMKSNKPQQRRFSKSSIMPIDENRPSASGTTQNSKTETVVKKTETETVTNNVNVSKTNGVKANEQTASKKPASKLETGSTISIKPGNRKSSVISVQRRPSRTTSVDIASTNGRVSPTIERKPISPYRKESASDKVSIRNMLATNGDKQQTTGSPKVSETSSTKSPKTRTTVTKNVSTSEQVSEKINEVKQPNKPTSVRKDSQRFNNENEDLLVTKKATVNDRRSQSFNPHDRTRPTERPSNKRTNTLQRDASKQRSRSRTPQRKQAQVNGHGPLDDFKMDREQYEKLGHDGNRPTRNRSGSRGGSNKTRKRSTSGGRKKSRKRSLSSERKKPKSNLKSRFPDIEKKNGKWKITPKSPKQQVSRNENVEEDEYVIERTVTPKPANQWQDLVAKYMRQPSPKIGRTDDRSLLDSNMTDDEDDEVDIFKRAQMRYKLNVDKTDDEDSDDDY